MLNQSFSAENFRRIIDYENRKGVYLEGKYFPLVAKVTESIKKLNFEIREKKKQFGKAEFDEFKISKNAEKDRLKSEKEEKLNIELQKVSEKIVAKGFKFELKKNESIQKKPVYTIDDTPEHYFALKQIQHNFKKLYKAKQASRYLIVSQVKCLLADGFPKYVIRTDIEDFYESIPQDKLLQKLSKDNLLAFLSRKIIRGMLDDYKLKSCSDKGIPRGIGASAYLAELYMRDIDNEIKALDEVIYYARYVDDIIVVFSPSANRIRDSLLDGIKDIFKKYFLAANLQKTEEIDLTQPQASGEIQYLGYRMIVSNGRIEVRLTDKKISKYKTRIDLAINSYVNFSKVNEKKARKLLVKRIRFLTGNTRLQNNKKNVLVGVYHSNSLLTNVEDLKIVDNHLEDQIVNQIKSVALRRRLQGYRFVEGFENRRYSPFSTRELSEIVNGWNHT